MTSQKGIIRSIGKFQFYCTVEEQLEDSVTMTDNPLQNGVLISDHFYSNPRKLSVHVGNIDEERGFANPRDTYTQVKECMDSGELLDVETKLSSYNNMKILTMSAVTNKETENTIELDLELREVILVETASTTVRVAAKPSSSTKTSVSTTTKGGTKAGDSVNGSTTGQSENGVSKNSAANRSFRDIAKNSANAALGTNR